MSIDEGKVRGILFIMRQYDHKRIEKKWQKEWAKKKLYRTIETKGKKKTFVLDMFPYPSGEGLHVGHPKGYIATDIYSRMQRMKGKNVLHPMGWDAFGLPAENFAIKNKIHPRKAVAKNVKRFKEQLEVIGLDYDWSREINTTDPAYYKWTQWIFLKLYEKGLAFQSNEPINWCPSCQTGLANEDLDGNVCERCGTVVEKRKMPQWVLKITAYADRMLKDLDTLRWPEHIKEQQRNWIGRSEGALIKFSIFNFQFANGKPAEIEVFTTRPDTIFGATYMVIAPEHPLIAEFCNKNVCTNKTEVEAYIKSAAAKTEIERTAEGKEKTGVRLEGVNAVNPATNEEIPIYVADYVLGHYGTGAIMAVPAHDERDYAFAKKFDLPIRQVIEPKYVGSEGENAVRPGMPFVPRNAVCAVVRNPADDTYLCVSWKKFRMHGLVTGGVEAGEDPVDAALREIREETGYKNVTFVRDPGIAIHSLFYHRVKEQNRHARFQYLFFELENKERDPIAEEENALHDVVWKKKEELRDWFSVIEGEFILNVLNNPDYVYTGAGLMVNSGQFDGMDSAAAKTAIIKAVGGKKKATYKIRDWVFSRQRYWGEPIPIIHCEKCGAVPVPYSQLPVKLPDVKKYEPTGTGESPLAAIEKWVNVKCPKCKGKARRETNTMPQWAGSSWYYLRFMDPKNTKALVDKKKEKYWAPVDVYVGGDHAVRHLIYARFWHKFLYDIKAVSTIEPFARLEFLGFILAEDGRKMSKRYGNVINPDDIVKAYGADSLRVYEMFMGPFTDTIAWNTNNMIGARRFIERVWRLGNKSDLFLNKSDLFLERILHQTIKKVGEDIEGFKFNTAVSAMMIFVNAAEKNGLSKKQFTTFLQLLAPFAPHVSDELWTEMGNSGRAGKKSIHLSAWPAFDARKLTADTVTLVVQVNGKVRAQMKAAADATQNDVQEEAESTIAKWIEGKGIRKVIFVPGRLINFVID